MKKWPAIQGRFSEFGTAIWSIWRLDLRVCQFCHTQIENVARANELEEVSQKFASGSESGLIFSFADRPPARIISRREAPCAG